MRNVLLLAGAATALLAFPALAQTAAPASPATPPESSATGSAVGAAGPSMSPPVNPPTAVPPGAAPATGATVSSEAATGTAANTSATAADLRTGVAVKDSAGLEIGKISSVTKGKTDAETMVTLSSGGKTATVPASSLSLSGGVLVTSQTKADVWAPR